MSDNTTSAEQEARLVNPEGYTWKHVAIFCLMALIVGALIGWMISPTRGDVATFSDIAASRKVEIDNQKKTIGEKEAEIASLKSAAALATQTPAFSKEDLASAVKLAVAENCPARQPAVVASTSVSKKKAKPREHFSNPASVQSPAINVVETCRFKINGKVVDTTTFVTDRVGGAKGQCDSWNIGKLEEYNSKGAKLRPSGG